MALAQLLRPQGHTQSAAAVLQAVRCLSSCCPQLPQQPPCSLMQPRSQASTPWAAQPRQQQCWGGITSALLPGLGSCRRSFFTPFSTPDSKVYKERRLIGYSPEQLYEVVSAVQHYHQFVPWCVGSHVLRRTPDGSYLEAELHIGFQMISERYTSRVQLQPPHSVSSTVADSALFHHLESTWRMSPGPRPNTTWLSFSVDFAFLNPLYANVAHLFFQEVVTRMMGAFEGRCKHLFGPPIFSARATAAAAAAGPAAPAVAVQQQQLEQQKRLEQDAMRQQQQQQLRHVPTVTAGRGGQAASAAAAGKADVRQVQPWRRDGGGEGG